MTAVTGSARRSRSRSLPHWRPTSLRRPAGRAATTCGCSCRTATARSRTRRSPTSRAICAPGDTLVVNTSATIAAAIAAVTPDGRRPARALLHGAAGRLWLVEARRPVGDTIDSLRRRPHRCRRRARRGRPPCTCSNASATRAGCGSRRRTWPRPCSTHLAAHGEPIRYKHAPGAWPLAAYQQVFGARAGQRGDARARRGRSRPSSSSTSCAGA